ncbi:histidine--tRNA ligase, partial [bacterium]|nr:histidine--tRNA ligase [bacterium]
MANIIKVLKGTKDILPQDIEMWHFVEENALKTFSSFGVKEIRTPIIESTDLFQRGVGETTDIVNKEMYTFEKSERSITLRPENTAGVVRSYIENGMHRLPAPVKLWYKGPMFRYERPQAGRQRQFHQVGVEMFGVSQPSADAEIILMAENFLKSIGLDDLDVEINSLGCPKCRAEFKENLKNVIRPYLNDLCEDCQSRFEKNPLRLLDCKVPSCQEIFSKPEIQKIITSDFLCDECREHYTQLKKYLDELNVKYSENKLLVRGLDYYTRTVFEIKSNNLGSQNAVCGGGRYDNLVSELGGEPTPAIGFAMGMERLISLLKEKECSKLDGYIVSNNTTEALKLAQELRLQGFNVEIDLTNKKFTKQLEKASKIANYAIILGEDEIEKNKVSVKNLKTGEQ